MATARLGKGKMVLPGVSLGVAQGRRSMRPFASARAVSITSTSLPSSALAGLRPWRVT